MGPPKAAIFQYLPVLFQELDNVDADDVSNFDEFRKVKTAFSSFALGDITLRLVKPLSDLDLRQPTPLPLGQQQGSENLVLSAMKG